MEYGSTERKYEYESGQFFKNKISAQLNTKNIF